MNCYENFIVNNFLFFTTSQLGLDGLPADPSRSGPWFQFLMLLVQSKTARDFFNYWSLSVSAWSTSLSATGLGLLDSVLGSSWCHKLYLDWALLMISERFETKWESTLWEYSEPLKFWLTSGLISFNRWNEKVTKLLYSMNTEK